jgi:vesicle-fusing ATPase
MEIEVDLLQKKSVSGGAPREIDTDRLASDFLLNYEGHVFEIGQTVAMDFEGTKFELRVNSVSQIDLSGKKPSEELVRSDDATRVGQLLAPTALTFARPQGTNLVALVGDKVAGGSGSANTIFLSDFDFEKLGIGGLDAEFNQIFRRAFASRIWPAHVIKQLGINHVRGMLLFGPPGCGKTLIARQIGKVLNAREPKIVNGPEILNKYVGGSEEKVRELFAEAEKEQLEMGDHSMLHIIILDEMDAICKVRGSNRSDSGVSDSVVNQLLSKIDGVDSLNNILLIGMTNRKDMIDDALLRPGRLEVHVEIGLPDAAGRLQILNIHTKNMKESNRISPEVLDRLDEISDKTKNFSGAEIEGLVKAATSYALTRCVDVKDLSKAPDEKNLIVQFDDFQRALDDVAPKFGAKSQEMKALYRNGFVPYGDSFDLLMGNMERLIEQVRTSEKTPLMSVLLQGPAASGKTAVAAKVAVESGYPFVRMISADEMIGYSDMAKCQEIHKAFLDSYKSPLSLILIDDIERIIEYVAIGPRFSNVVLQTLLVLLKKVPPDQGRRLLIIGTTSCPHLLQDLGLTQAFGVNQSTNLLDEPLQISEVLRVAAHLTESDAEAIANAITKPIGIKTLLMVAEMAKQGSKGGAVNVNVFLECLHTVGY